MVSCTLLPGAALIYQIHSLLGGYVLGYLGLLKEPVAPDNSPPQPVKTARLSQFKEGISPWEKCKMSLKMHNTYFRRKIIKL